MRMLNAVKQLPVRWMLRNGYSVPPDMMQICDEIAASSAGSDSSAGEMWKDTKHNIQINQNHADNMSKPDDLSNRVTPGVIRQYRYFLGRIGKQRLREARGQAADYLILLLAGACLGTLAKANDEEFGAHGYTYTIIDISLLCKISSLRIFLLDKLHFKRESSSGMNTLSYFVAKDTIERNHPFFFSALAVFQELEGSSKYNQNLKFYVGDIYATISSDQDDNGTPTTQDDAEC